MTLARKVLDHGYIKIVETWGSDEAIVEAARMSTGKGFNGWGESPCSECGGNGIGPDRIDGPGEVYQNACDRCGGKGRTVGDEKLLRYLYENAHATPFEFAGMVIEVKAPIVVFREWHRHRTQSYNEASARYAPLPDDNYVPILARCLLGGGHITKQAGAIAGASTLDEAGADAWRARLADFYAEAETLYQEGLASGIPKELARLVLPVGRYSKMRAQANLRNWLGFMTLRSTAKNPHAQWEIRQYADAVGDLVAEAFPRTWALFSGGKTS